MTCGDSLTAGLTGAILSTQDEYLIPPYLFLGGLQLPDFQEVLLGDVFVFLKPGRLPKPGSDRLTVITKR